MNRTDKDSEGNTDSFCDGKHLLPRYLRKSRRYQEKTRPQDLLRPCTQPDYLLGKMDVQVQTRHDRMSSDGQTREPSYTPTLAHPDQRDWINEESLHTFIKLEEEQLTGQEFSDQSQGGRMHQGQI